MQRMCTTAMCVHAKPRSRVAAVDLALLKRMCTTAMSVHVHVHVHAKQRSRVAAVDLALSTEVGMYGN